MVPESPRTARNEFPPTEGAPHRICEATYVQYRVQYSVVNWSNVWNTQRVINTVGKALRSAAPVSFEKSSSLHETHNEYICNSRRHVILHSFLRRGISCPAAIAAHIAATRSKGPREARAAASQSGMSFMALWKARSEGVSPGQPRHAPPSTALRRPLSSGGCGRPWVAFPRRLSAWPRA